MYKILMAAALMTFSVPASAQMIVLGTGLSRTCYETALVSQTVDREDIEVCTKALSQAAIPRDKRIATLVNRGILFMRAGDYDRAIDDYDLALKMDDSNGAAYINKGAALIYKGQYDEALLVLNTAVALNPDDLHAAYYNRALVLEQQGDLNAAYDDLTKALELKPEWDLAVKQLDRYVVTSAS